MSKEFEPVVCDDGEVIETVEAGIGKENDFSDPLEKLEEEGA